MSMHESTDIARDWYREAKLHTDNGDFAQALVCIEHHLTSKHARRGERILYAEILGDLRRFDDAEEVLSELDIPETHKAYWLVCFAWTRLYRIAGAYENAAMWARRLVELRPDWSVGHIYLGSVLARLGRFDDAVAAYQPATTLPADRDNDPDEACLNIALIRRAQCRFEDASAFLDQAIEIDPDYELYKTVRDDVLAALQLQKEIARIDAADNRPTPEVK